MRFNLRQLKYINAAARHGSLTHAAKEMRVAKSSISIAIDSYIKFQMQNNLSNWACPLFFQGFFKNIFRKYPVRDIFVFFYPCKPGTFPRGKVLLEIGKPNAII